MRVSFDMLPHALSQPSWRIETSQLDLSTCSSGAPLIEGVSEFAPSSDIAKNPAHSLVQRDGLLFSPRNSRGTSRKKISRRPSTCQARKWMKIVKKTTREQEIPN